jgi:hypothetical protein
MSDVRRHQFRRLFYESVGSVGWRTADRRSICWPNCPIPKTPLNFASQISLSVEFFPSLVLSVEPLCVLAGR